MTKQKAAVAGVSQGLYVLWVIGVVVGLGIAGEWKTLFVFSTTVVAVHAFIGLVTQLLTRRSEREK